MSIRHQGASLGRMSSRFAAGGESRVQIYLAGFAAEELIKGCRSKQFIGKELSLSIAALTKPELAFLGSELETRDQFLAVRDILGIGAAKSEVAIRAEIERFYIAAKDSLAAIWPMVRAVARSLLKHTDLDYGLFRAVVGSRDIYEPVFAVQEAHGLLRREPLPRRNRE